MKNPWKELPLIPPFLLPIDRASIDRFAISYNKIRLDVLPCPYLGNPQNANIYLLNFNPSFADSVLKDNRNQNYIIQVRRSFAFQSDYPFWALDPNLSECSGYRWWSIILKQLLDRFDRNRLANQLMCIQYFPYHSVNKQDVMGLHVPSQEYSFDLVKQAIKNKKMIVVMRSKAEWLSEVAELRNYPIIELKNVRRPFISPGNMNSGIFEEIVNIIDSEI